MRLWRWLVRVSGGAAGLAVILAATWTHIIAEVLFWSWWAHTGQIERVDFGLSLWTLIVDTVILLGQRASSQQADRLMQAQTASMQAQTAHLETVEAILRELREGRPCDGAAPSASRSGALSPASATPSAAP